MAQGSKKWSGAGCFGRGAEQCAHGELGVGAVLLHRHWKKAVPFTEIEGAPGWGESRSCVLDVLTLRCHVEVFNRQSPERESVIERKGWTPRVPSIEKVLQAPR